MLRLTPTFFAPDDVSVPCRVRRSEAVTEREFTEVEDMTCTMRVWHKASGPPSSETLSRSAEMVTHRNPPSIESSRNFMVLASTKFQPTPELILTPVCNTLVEQPNMCCSADFGSDPIPLSERFLSFGSVDHSVSSRSGRAHQTRSPRTNNSPHKGEGPDCNNDTATRRRIGTMTIPLKDIMMMDVKVDDEDASATNRINITTMSSGFFEVTMDSTNGRDVLLAFLKARMPKDRVVVGGELARKGSNSTHNTYSAKSFDVEAFTASRMSERLKSESLSEKVQRRIYRLVSSLDEMSSSITECACGCPNNSATSPAPNEDRLEKRDSPPPANSGSEIPRFHYDRVEMAPEALTPVRDSPPRIPPLSSGKYTMLDDRCAIDTTTSKSKKVDMLRQSHMPSGLSVESDPDSERNSSI